MLKRSEVWVAGLALLVVLPAGALALAGGFDGLWGYTLFRIDDG